MSNGEVAMIQKKEIEAEIKPVVREATALVISDQQSRDSAMLFLKNVKTMQKRVTDFFTPIKQAARAAWQKTVDGENELLKPLQDAEAHVKTKVIGFDREVERRRIEEQRRLQAIADEEARRERERLEKQAAKIKTPELREERLAAAAAVVAPVVEMAPVIEKQGGEATKKVWKARVLDAAKVPREWMIVDEKALNAFARATKGAKSVEGVQFYAEDVLSVSVK